MYNVLTMSFENVAAYCDNNAESSIPEIPILEMSLDDGFKMILVKCHKDILYLFFAHTTEDALEFAMCTLDITGKWQDPFAVFMEVIVSYCQFRPVGEVTRFSLHKKDGHPIEDYSISGLS